MVKPTGRPRKPLAYRLWLHILRQGDDDCWPWTGYKGRGGYGSLRGDDQRTVMAHRAAYESFHGPIPEGLCACHECDNPACCNPRHMFLGTQQENINDKCRKARQARGSGHANAKLTEKDVTELRFIWRTGRFSQDELASRYGVDRSTLIRVLHGRSWTHVGGAMTRTMTPAEASAKAATFYRKHAPLSDKDHD